MEAFYFGDLVKHSEYGTGVILAAIDFTDAPTRYTVAWKNLEGGIYNRSFSYEELELLVKSPLDPEEQPWL